MIFLQCVTIFSTVSFWSAYSTGWLVVKTDSICFLKNKNFVREENIFIYKWMLTDNSGNPRQTRQIFQRSCLYYSDLSNFFPHFGSVELILNIPWNRLYIWLWIYSIWSKIASKSLTKYTLTWKERGRNSSKKWLLLPKFEFCFSGCYNLTNTQGKQEAGLFYALDVSDDMNYSGKQYSTLKSSGWFLKKGEMDFQYQALKLFIWLVILLFLTPLVLNWIT